VQRTRLASVCCGETTGEPGNRPQSSLLSCTSTWYLFTYLKKDILVKQKMDQEGSLEELMAQFRQLEKNGDSHVDSLVEKPTHASSSFQNQKAFSSSMSSFPFMSTPSWFPLMSFMGGIFVLTVLLVSVFRPRFLYSVDSQFLWKRYMITVLITFVLLMGALWGLHFYITRFFRL